MAFTFALTVGPAGSTMPARRGARRLLPKPAVLVRHCYGPGQMEKLAAALLLRAPRRANPVS